MLVIRMLIDVFLAPPLPQQTFDHIPRIYDLTIYTTCMIVHMNNLFFIDRFRLLTRENSPLYLQSTSAYMSRGAKIVRKIIQRNLTYPAVIICI